METRFDLSRWREKPRGVAYRRWVIVSTGLRQLLGMRFFQILVLLAWIAGVLVAAMGFVFSQSLSGGGWFESLAANFGPRGQAVVSAFSAMLLLYPDIFVTGLFTAAFSLQAWVGLSLSLIALTIVVPRLIARDRAGNALTLYLARPLTSTDYLLGKLGIIAGIILLLWTGPLLLGWVLSMALSPNMDFFVHSFGPLANAVLYSLIGLAVIAPLALAVSSLGKSAATVTPLWIGLWIVAGMIAKLPPTPEVVRCASFTHDIETVGSTLFRFDEIIIKAGDALPPINQNVNNAMIEFGRKQARGRKTAGAATGLVVIVAVSSFVFARRLRPE